MSKSREPIGKNQLRLEDLLIAPPRSRINLPNKRRGLRETRSFSAVRNSQVQWQGHVQWLCSGARGSLQLCAVLRAANGQNGQNAVAGLPLLRNCRRDCPPHFSWKGGIGAVPTVRARAAGGVRVRSRPAWRLALTSRSKADMAQKHIFLYPDSPPGASRSVKAVSRNQECV